MKLYMIRHGESEANRERRHAGWAQVPLSEKGVLQAEAAGQKLKDISFDRVIASDLLRSRQTCEIALPGCTYEQSPLIREINVGKLSGSSAQECQAVYGDAYIENKLRQDFTPYGGENREMMIQRVSDFIGQAETFQAENIAVFTHEGVLRMTLELIFEIPQLKQKLLCGNCCISVFECTEGKWRLNAWNI